MIRPKTLRVLTISLFLAILAAGCSGGSGGSGGGAIGFQLTRISLPNGAVWQINREIEFSFSEPVDFSTVSLNTINLQSENGAPATGTFSFRQIDTDGDGVAETVDEATVIFQPHCPTEPDLSDAGLAPGGITYNLVVVGQSSQTLNTVRSQNGQALNTTQSRTFTTPASTNPAAVFLDTTQGPPEPVVRSAGATQVVEGVTYVEIGNNPDPGSRIFFEFDASTQTYSAVPGPSAPAAAPLNLYSSESTRVAVVIEFNQPVDPSSTNISQNRLSLEFLDGAVWVPVDTLVELVANCTTTGARVRLEPIGLLPPGSEFRAVVHAGFQDIVGQTILLPLEYLEAPTQELDYANLMNPTDGADEFLEQFNFGGNDELSFQDTSAVFAVPEAEWDNGLLKAAFTFSGTGGPGGNFDWVVRGGESFFFDTTSTQIIGGPGGIPTTIQNSTGGIVDVRNFTIEVGGEVRVQGPNPFQLNATGDVRIEGVLDVSGFQAKDVSTLNTGNQVEQGGSGAAGGGRGGNANEITNNSTPRGGFGQGPLGEVNTGGQGGESGFAPSNLGKDARRPGGGGGGRFAADQPPLIAENGFPGSATSTGPPPANNQPAMGGLAGTGPFVDGDTTNDFFGVKPVVSGGQLTGLIRGELTRLWAGYGGGGGGNALPSSKFPTPRWSPQSDEKGGGGGGGGGNCRIRALGRIVFGASGLVQVKGARGATGENTNFLDHIGGSGGSGSGGHVILESATEIDFTDGGLNVGVVPRNWVDATGAATVTGSKSPQGGVPIPCGISHGGAGGPGVIQLHVPDPISPPSNNPAVTDIVVPTSALGSGTPLAEIAGPDALAMIPTFGAQSVARSKWISIGGADRMPGGGADLVQFLFEGTQTSGADEGKILATNAIVNELPPLLGPETVGGTNPNVAIEADEVTLRISGSSLNPLINDPSPISDDIYLRTPVLLRNFILRLWLMQAPANFQDFNVVDATYDDVAQILLVTVSGAAGTLQDFVTAAGPGAIVEYQLIPRFFRVITNNVESSLPNTAFVQIRFEATGDDGTGNPDEQNILVPLTGDISEFNDLAPGELQFFRFQVDFNLDAQSQGVSALTKPVTLDFLRIPFRF